MRRRYAFGFDPRSRYLLSLRLLGVLALTFLSFGLCPFFVNSLSLVPLDGRVDYLSFRFRACHGSPLLVESPCHHRIGGLLLPALFCG